MITRLSSSLLPGRNRLGHALAMGIVVAGGLLLRSRFWTLPVFLAKYGGDALWALLVYLGLGFLFRQLSIRRLALASLCLAWSIEFLQLYHAPWLDAIRSTRLGHLILGSTFNWPDLLAYALGIAIGAFFEYQFICRSLDRKVG